MSRAKREMERLEGLTDAATSIALKTGAIAECEFHDGIYIDQEDDEAVSHAYALATNKVKAGEVDGTREEMMEAVKEAIGSAGDGCYLCAKHRDE